MGRGAEEIDSPIASCRVQHKVVDVDRRRGVGDVGSSFRRRGDVCRSSSARWHYCRGSLGGRLCPEQLLPDRETGHFHLVDRSDSVLKVGVDLLEEWRGKERREKRRREKERKEKC